MALKYNSCAFSHVCDKCTTLYGELIHKYLIVMNQCPTTHINKDIRKRIWMFLKPSFMRYKWFYHWELCDKHEYMHSNNIFIRQEKEI